MSRDAELIAHLERILAKFPAVAASWYASSSGMIFTFRDTVGYHALQIESVALVRQIYGADHPQAKEFRQTIRSETLSHFEAAEGQLRGMIESIRHGLLTDLRTQMLLDVQGDFLDAARKALEGGGKDVAAVLASIVLEDSVKRLASKSKLEKLLDREFSVVVTELFKVGVITKTTKGALLAHKDLRNSALHAQWHEISPEAVQALLHLLPVFLEQHGV